MVHWGGQVRRGSEPGARVSRACHAAILGAAVVATVMTSSAPPALAQPAVGFQGGFAADSVYPEQLFGGVFFQTGDLGRGIRLRPGIDGATGDGLRIGTVNFDLIYGYPLGANGWTLLAGGGPTIVIRRVPESDFRDTAVGFHSMLGFGHDSGFFFEVRLGSGQAQELKLGVGWAIAFN